MASLEVLFFRKQLLLILSLAGKRTIGFFIAMVLWKWIKYDGDTTVGSTYIPLIYWEA